MPEAYFTSLCQPHSAIDYFNEDNKFNHNPGLDQNCGTLTTGSSHHYSEGVSLGCHCGNWLATEVLNKSTDVRVDAHCAGCILHVNASYKFTLICAQTYHWQVPIFRLSGYRRHRIITDRTNKHVHLACGCNKNTYLYNYTLVRTWQL